MEKIRHQLEERQISIYFAAVAVAVMLAFIAQGMAKLEAWINPALAFMLFVTFLQVPLADLGRTFTRVRFPAALLVTNFVLVPILVAVLVQFLRPDPLIRLGVLLVLLTPCIDYVVTFSQLGKADARLLLASTPALLILQMLLLPAYLGVFLGSDVSRLVQLGPFIHAFVWLIAVPLVLAAAVQLWAARSKAGERASSGLGLLCVPATAAALFIVIASVVPQLASATDAVLQVIPLYIAFAAISPVIGWSVGRAFGLEAPAGRALAFSAGTRNSLVVLPLALTVPGAVPLLPAIILTQTLVELVSELVYIRVIGKMGTPEIVAQTKPGS